MLTAKNINLSYGASQALFSVNLDAEVGKVTSVMGRNGVGKTSLMRALVGRHPCTAEELSIEGQSLIGANAYEFARSGVAYVPQGREVFSQLTVKENLETGFAAAPRGQRFVPDEIYTLFPVLKDMLSRRGGDLSGGQQQQLAIARALIMRPKVLVLDEPTEGIQPSIIKDIGEVIKRLRRRGDMAIVLVEQYLDFALDLADNWAVLDRGKVVASGNRESMETEYVRSLVSV